MSKERKSDLDLQIELVAQRIAAKNNRRMLKFDRLIQALNHINFMAQRAKRDTIKDTENWKKEFDNPEVRLIELLNSIENIGCYCNTTRRNFKKLVSGSPMGK